MAWVIDLLVQKSEGTAVEALPESVVAQNSSIIFSSPIRWVKATFRFLILQIPLAPGTPSVPSSFAGKTTSSSIYRPYADIIFPS
jgi:hypothetical protein